MTKKSKPGPDEARGVTRRGFITSIGAGAVVTATSTAAAAAQTAEKTAADEMVPVTLVVNRRRHKLRVEPRWSLLFVLREKLGLTGSKEGCGRGECGACTVLLDGVSRYACMTLAVEAEGAEITTVEGLMDGESLGPVQQAFLEEDALQCGFCTSGQVMAAQALLLQQPHPDPDTIRRSMSGNLCRCGTYQNIVRAVTRAADQGKGGTS